MVNSLGISKLDKKKLLILLTVILSVGILYSLYQIGNRFLQARHNSSLNNRLKKIHTSKKEAANYKDRYSSLIKINSDIIGWLNVPGTAIDYPVVKTTDNSYYLTHNFNKENSAQGAIFMDFRNIGNGEDKNTILYGHNMKDGSMFEGLCSYKDEAFLTQHPIIEFDTLDKAIKWQIFSIYVTDTNFYYIQTAFTKPSDFMLLLSQMQKRSLFTTKVNITEADNILTLSTCSYEFNNARFVVEAKKIN